MGISNKLRNLMLCCVVGVGGGAWGAQYGLLKDYSGEQFFDGWDFYNNCEWFFECVGWNGC
jgi:hypothetical protein